MFFRKHKEKEAFQKLLPTERLQDLFSNQIIKKINAPTASYIKSKRAIRFSNELYNFEVAWDQSKFNTRQSDSRFQMRWALFSPKYRQWEKEFYGLPKRLTGQALDSSLVQKGHGFILSFENRQSLTNDIASIIDDYFENYFSHFHNWDDQAIDKLKESTWVFKQTVPLTITDFLIIQNRYEEARACLNENDSWYKKFIEQEKSGGEGLNDMWGSPYYLRLNKLAELLD